MNLAPISFDRKHSNRVKAFTLLVEAILVLPFAVTLSELSRLLVLHIIYVLFVEIMFLD